VSVTKVKVRKDWVTDVLGLFNGEEEVARSLRGYGTEYTAGGF